MRKSNDFRYQSITLYADIQKDVVKTVDIKAYFTALQLKWAYFALTNILYF